MQNAYIILWVDVESAKMRIDHVAICSEETPTSTPPLRPLCIGPTFAARTFEAAQEAASRWLRQHAAGLGYIK